MLIVIQQQPALLTKQSGSVIASSLQAGYSSMKTEPLQTIYTVGVCRLAMVDHEFSFADGMILTGHTI